MKGISSNSASVCESSAKINRIIWRTMENNLHLCGGTFQGWEIRDCPGTIGNYGVKPEELYSLDVTVATLLALVQAHA